jgi:hypothetical protein
MVVKGAKTASYPTWEGSDYPRVTPGRYDAVVKEVRGPEWVRQYSRWSVMIEFELLSEPVSVCAFLNMGNDPKRPSIGRQSKYFKAWTIANGALPCKGETMNQHVFLEHQVFQIDVDDSGMNPEQQKKPDSEVYSRATNIVAACRP